MHIGKILKECIFRVPDASGGFMADGQEVLEQLKDMHPLQIINSSIAIPLYCVMYEYDTVRGNRRVGKKYFFGNVGGSDSYEQEIMADTYLSGWVDNFNSSHPFRAISNVKILEVVHLANAHLGGEIQWIPTGRKMLHSITVQGENFGTVYEKKPPGERDKIHRDFGR